LKQFIVAQKNSVRNLQGLANLEGFCKGQNFSEYIVFQLETFNVLETLKVLPIYNKKNAMLPKGTSQ